jgi:brefeldin A-inhibited guanine nucleotide-exchange protein
MLNTDQHNPQVKKRMEESDFIKNNRGINDGQNLPEEMLKNIFEDIRKDEIKLKDNRNKSTVNEESASRKAKPKSSKADKAASNEPVNAQVLTNAIRQNRGATMDLKELDLYFHPSESNDFVEASNIGHIKPMFQTAWMAFLISLSSYLQTQTNPVSLRACFHGFKLAVHICSIYSLEVEMKALLTNLSQMAELTELIDLKEKTIDVCKTLIEISHDAGENFRDHWNMIVKCISNLERINSSGIAQLDPSQKRSDNEYAEKMYTLISSQSMSLSVDRIFTSSVQLTIEPMCAFAKSLCERSWDEIISSSNKVIFI